MHLNIIISRHYFVQLNYLTLENSERDVNVRLKLYTPSVGVVDTTKKTF